MKRFVTEHPGPPDPSPQLLDVALALRAPWESREAVIFSPRITGAPGESKGKTDMFLLWKLFLGLLVYCIHRSLSAKLKVFGDAFFDFKNKKTRGQKSPNSIGFDGGYRSPPPF